jgi:quercetin 2,3-dioxygenase
MPHVAAEECASLNREAVFETYPARATALGSLQIARALPVRRRRLIGPWCFLDRYGPLSFSDDKPMDVAPHPHIGLQTVSWLVEGEVVHHDSLGCEAVVRPGGVNLMTSGRGIAHSEETPMRNAGRLHGVQLWVALPREHRGVAPRFDAIAQVPREELRGGVVQIFMSQGYSDVIGIDAEVHRGETLTMPARAEREHGVMILAGDAKLDGRVLEPDAIHYLGRGRSELAFRSRGGARLLLIGGEPFAEPILMWWNFVAGSAEEISEAREDWERHRRFGEVVAYDGPRIPAPPLGRISAPNPAS